IIDGAPGLDYPWSERQSWVFCNEFPDGDLGGVWGSSEIEERGKGEDMRRFWLMKASLLYGLLLAAFATAQTTSTEILGTVVDPTGAVVPSAKVTLLRL